MLLSSSSRVGFNVPPNVCRILVSDTANHLNMSRWSSTPDPVASIQSQRQVQDKRITYVMGKSV